MEGISAMNSKLKQMSIANEDFATQLPELIRKACNDELDKIVQINDSLYVTMTRKKGIVQYIAPKSREVLHDGGYTTYQVIDRPPNVRDDDIHCIFSQLAGPLPKKDFPAAPSQDEFDKMKTKTLLEYYGEWSHQKLAKDPKHGERCYNKVMICLRDYITQTVS